MRRTEALDRADAIEALRVAEFPVLLEEDSPKEVVITNREHHGLEGMLPAKLFAPTPYYVGHPQFAELAGDPLQAAFEVTKRWNGNVHVDAVLESHFGRYASRVSTHMLQEMVYLSASGHHANIAFLAGRILVDPEAKQETMFAMWDDGTPYASADEIQQRFSLDGFHDLTDGSVVRPTWRENTAQISYPPAPTTIVVEATRVFGGSLSVLSGEARTDITHDEEAFRFEHSSTPGIIGNLVVARLPHTASLVHVS